MTALDTFGYFLVWPLPETAMGILCIYLVGALLYAHWHMMLPPCVKLRYTTSCLCYATVGGSLRWTSVLSSSKTRASDYAATLLYTIIMITSAVSSTNLGSIFIFAGCVIHRPARFHLVNCHDSSIYLLSTKPTAAPPPPVPSFPVPFLGH